MDRKDELKTKLQKLYGLYPYDTLDNIVYGDGIFARSIERDYSKEEIDNMKKRLGLIR